MENDFETVEKLRDKLKNDYPILKKLHQSDGVRYGSVKIRRIFDAPVRPTVSSDEMSSMMKNSSKFRRIQEIDFPTTPRNNKPISIKTQE